MTALPRNIRLTNYFLTIRVNPDAPLQPQTIQDRLVWADPRSLAATKGISIDFYSCWYLDGSVPSVYLLHAILFTHK